MAKIVDLKQGTGNVFPRTIGEAVAVGGKLLTEAISTLDEKVSAVDDLISGESTGTVMVAPNAENIVIGNTDKSNLFIGTNNSFYMDYKGKTTIGANSNKIEVDPEYDTIKIGNQAAPTNLISVTKDGVQIGHNYNSIKIGSNDSISIRSGNQQIKLSSDNNLTIGYNDAIKINPEGKITFSENSGVPVNTDNTVKLSKITPSGDLQHYMYEQIGAIYNDTDSDIVRDAPWADLVDDDNPDDKYVTHKAGYWYMNGLGDLTNEDMRNILTYGKYIPTTPMCNSYPCTVRTVWNKGGNCHSAQLAFCNNTYIKSITLFFLVHSYDHFLYNCRNLKYVCSIDRPKTDNMFYNCLSLQYIKLGSCYANIFIQYSPLLSAKSVLHMIQNAQTTTDFTITLHDDAYARAIGNADVIAALEAKPNITLASDSGLEYNGTTTTSTTTGMASSTTSGTTGTTSGTTSSSTTSSSTTSTTTPQS